MTGKRQTVRHIGVDYGVSERQACKILDVDRSLIRCRSKGPDDTAARARLPELSVERKRFGYRRLHILLPGKALKGAGHRFTLLCADLSSRMLPWCFHNICDLPAKESKKARNSLS